MEKEKIRNVQTKIINLIKVKLDFQQYMSYNNKKDKNLLQKFIIIHYVLKLKLKRYVIKNKILKDKFFIHKIMVILTNRIK